MLTPMECTEYINIQENKQGTVSCMVYYVRSINILYSGLVWNSR